MVRFKKKSSYSALQISRKHITYRLSLELNTWICTSGETGLRNVSNVQNFSMIKCKESGTA